MIIDNKNIKGTRKLVIMDYPILINPKNPQISKETSDRILADLKNWRLLMERNF